MRSNTLTRVSNNPGAVQLGVYPRFSLNGRRLMGVRTAEARHTRWTGPITTRTGARMGQWNVG